MPFVSAMKLAQDLDKIEKVPIRDGYGKGLVIAGEKNKNVVVLCADLTESTRSLWFQQKFPDRFVQVGVAEQNMASVAAGMAVMGKISFISSYAMFSPGRNWEQIRTTIAYNAANVKIGGAHAGISVGPDGATHQALEDVAIMRALPTMTVLVPCDAIEARKATTAAAELVGPVYLRFAREKTPVMTKEETPFQIGKAEVYWNNESAEVAIIANGPMVYEALLAARALEKEKIPVMVINNHTVKPLDKKTILDAAKRCGAVVTAEEHQAHSGMGSAVAEYLAQTYPVPIKFIGVQDRFGESGAPGELMQKFGLTSKEIMQAVKDVIALRERHETVYETFAETPEYAGRRLKEVVPELSFRLHGGGVVRSIPGLKKALEQMPNDVFSHHVRNGKNDFAAWIKDVFKDETLAKAVEHCKTKDELQMILQLRVGR